MAQNRESPFHPSSPHSSSGGADSFKGTPDTRLTSFSPEEGSTKSARFLRGATRSASATPVKLSVNRYHGGASSVDKDPFTTPVRGKGLSPTASTFQPFTTATRSTLQTEFESLPAILSSERGISRLLSLSYPSSTTLPDVETWLNELEQQGILSGADRYAEVFLASIYIQFDDIRDACQAHASSRSQRKDWSFDFVTPANMSKDISQHFNLNSKLPGQIIALAVVTMKPPHDTYRVAGTLKKALQYHGPLFALGMPSSFPDGTFRVFAEYCCASTAITAARVAGTAQTIEGLQLTILLPSMMVPEAQDLADAFHGMSLGKDSVGAENPKTVASRPPPTASVHFPAFTMYPFMIQPPYSSGLPYMVDSGMSGNGQPSPMGPMSPGYSVLGALYQTPPSPALTSHNLQSPSRSVSSYARSEARRQNATRVNRSPHHNAAGHHNHVDIQRIREGIDVRTTIMLRNIPNKVDQSMLKRIVDESSWGKYDFMYLRIDFANDCNVGYAFINFVDPLDIIDFVDARGNQRWNCFKSDKVAEISYATIQGKDCLVQKFRNSSVMLEAPHYRPKLYFTSNGPMPELAGEEEPFPDPDNQSKMKRSCENAEHVGLFTPNAGQHFRDEQRRRRSQYDRGTRLAALEEYDYESSFHQIYGASTQ